MIHDLKIWPEFFSRLESGEKRFEIRKNDRGFSVGDTLLLREFEPVRGRPGGDGTYTGNRAMAHVLYLTNFCCESGHICMQLDHPFFWHESEVQP